MEKEAKSFAELIYFAKMETIAWSQVRFVFSELDTICTA